jgi:hypothetical protein
MLSSFSPQTAFYQDRVLFACWWKDEVKKMVAVCSLGLRFFH